MQFRYFILYFLSYNLSFICAQNREIDSLQILINQIDTQKFATLTLRIDLYEKLTQAKMKISRREGMDSDLTTLGELYRAAHDTLSYISVIYLNKAVWLSRFKTEIGSALVYYQRYINAIQKAGKMDSINPFVYIDIGNLYYQLNIWESAQRYYQLAEQAFANTKDLKALSTVYNNFAFVAQKQKNWDTAFYYNQKATALSQELADTMVLAYCYSVAGRIQQQQEEYTLSKHFYLKAAELSRIEEKKYSNSFLGYLQMPPYLCFRIAECFYEENLLQNSSFYLDSAQLFMKNHNLEYEEINNKIADLRVKILIQQADYQAAIQLANEKIRLMLPNDTITICLFMYENLYNIYRKIAQTDKMNEFGFKLYQLKDATQKSLYDEKLLMTNNLVLQLQNQQTIDNQYLTIENQRFTAQKEAQIRFYLWLALFLVLIILTIIAYSVFYLRRQNKLIKKYSTELENSNKDKELLLSVIGHDVRSPFQSIFNNIDQMYSYFDAAKQSPILQKLAQAKKSAEQVFVLLDNLLQWVLLQKQQLKPKDEEINLTDLWQELKTLFANMSLLEHLRVEIAPDLPLLRTDKTLITIIFRNLLLNAIKYSRINSTILISCQIVDNQCFIAIENEIDSHAPALIERINAYKEKQDTVFRGGGLGLRLVAEIAPKINAQFAIFSPKEKTICSQIIFSVHICTPQIVGNQLIKAKNIVEKTGAYFQFLPAEKAAWEIFIAQISSCEVYESSRIKTIFQPNGLTWGGDLLAWRNDLHRAARELDEELFNDLIQKLKLSFVDE